MTHKMLVEVESHPYNKGDYTQVPQAGQRMSLVVDVPEECLINGQFDYSKYEISQFGIIVKKGTLDALNPENKVNIFQKEGVTAFLMEIECLIKAALPTIKWNGEWNGYAHHYTEYSVNPQSIILCPVTEHGVECGVWASIPNTTKYHYSGRGTTFWL